MHDFIAYADGACSGNPGPGGWAFQIVSKGSDKSVGPVEQCGGSLDTTNNIMELTAALAMLQYVEENYEPCSILIVLDSQYVLDGIFKWMASWERNNWRTSSKKDVKNVELWKKVSILWTCLKSVGFEFEAKWVKGHSGDIGNERVDTLAQSERDRYVGLRMISPDPENASASLDQILAIDAVAPQTSTPVVPVKSDEVTPQQVALMRTILDGYVDGSSSVKDVLNTLRKSGAELAIGQ